MHYYHMHTLSSGNDGAQTPLELCERIAQLCKEENITQVSIMVTEHGHMMSIDELMEAATKVSEKYGIAINVIPAAELYTPSYQSDDTTDEEMSYTGDDDDDEEESAAICHLVVAAKDEIGLKALYRACTAGFDNEIKGRPVVPHAVFQRLFGPGAPAHGHVIAMSACMQGPLCVEALFNETIEKQALKQERRANRIALDTDKYTRLSAEIGELSETIEELTALRKSLGALKDKKYTARQKQVNKLQGTPEYAEAQAALDAEMAESAEAAAQFPLIKEKEKEVSKQLTALKAEFRKLEDKMRRFQEIMDAADAIRETKVGEDVLYEKTMAAAQFFNELFGAGNFYAEMQYHGIPQEALCFPMVANIAEELGIPVVATNDAHIAIPTEEAFLKRRILRALRFNRWKEDQVGDDQLYIKSEEELRAALIQILPGYVVDQAIANQDIIARECRVEVTHEEHYPKFISDTGEDALTVLKRLCNDKYKEYRKTLPREVWQTYVDRIRYEVEVIDKLGVADYLLIVQDFLEYGRLLGRIDLEDPAFLADPFNIDLLKKLGKGNVGMSIGLGRGSAVGSLVCYLIGITDADPIKYNLLFERFLNTERVTMPKQYWAFNVNFIAQRCAA